MLCICDVSFNLTVHNYSTKAITYIDFFLVLAREAHDTFKVNSNKKNGAMFLHSLKRPEGRCREWGIREGFAIRCPGYIERKMYAKSKGLTRTIHKIKKITLSRIILVNVRALYSKKQKVASNSSIHKLNANRRT